MSILIDKSTRLIVQGITGRDGLFHAKKMKEYGTNVVGGTSPGKGGTEVDGIPVLPNKEGQCWLAPTVRDLFLPEKVW